MTKKKVVDKWLNKIHLAECIDSDYCDNVEVSLIKDTIKVLDSQHQEIEELKDYINDIDKIILDEQEYAKRYFGYNFVMDIRKKFDELIKGEENG